MAHDQRYCLDCGARRGPLPPHVAEFVARTLERGRPSLGAQSGPAAGLGATGSVRAAPLVLTPRLAAIAVLGMLAFGVAVGSVVGRGVTRLASAPLLILEPWRAQPVARSDVGRTRDLAASSPPAAGSPGAATRTITVGGTQTPTTPSFSSASGGGSGPSGGPSNPLGLPAIKHVFLIILSDHGYSQTFAPGAPDPYLSRTLAHKGELLPFYYAVTAGSLANEIALISGQGPTPQTAANCPRFAAITPATRAAHGQVLGGGCVYPARTQTLAEQLSAAGEHWRAYIQGVGGSGRAGCRYPRLGALDDRAPSARRPYLTYRNPFVYFRSVTARADCANHEVGLAGLADDLRSSSTTPAFSYIVADPCHDGSEHRCRHRGRSGLAAADTFLRSVVSEIEQSAAFDDGLIAITFDQAPQSGPHADHSSCCNNPTFPNLSSTSESPPAAAAMTADVARAGSPTTASTLTTTSTTADTTTSSVTSTSSTTTATSTTQSTSTTSSTTTATSTTQSTSTIPTTTTSTTPTSTTPSSPIASTIPTATATTSAPPGATTSLTTAPSPPSPPSSTTTTPPRTTTPGSATGETNPTGGGGQVGMLLLSPYVKAGSTDVTSYFNHFSLLKTVEAVFGLRYLGYAREITTPAFDSSVFSAAG